GAAKGFGSEAWFRLAARVGCSSRDASLGLEEWPHSLAAMRDGQNPAYRPSGVSPRSQWRGDFLKWSGMAKQKRSDDWGFPRWRSLGDEGRHGPASRVSD